MSSRGVQNVKNIELKLAKQFFSLPWSILMTTKNFSSIGQREDPAVEFGFSRKSKGPPLVHEIFFSHKYRQYGYQKLCLALTK